MNNLLKTALVAALVLPALSACNDDDSTIGSSLIQDQIEIVIADDFVAEGHSVASGSVQSRTVLQLLGAVDAKEYGSFSSDVVTQFMPARTLATDGVIDSVRLIMRVPTAGVLGDSLTPMGLEVYRLNKQLPLPIFSNFNPAGYYDPTPVASVMYNISSAGLTDQQMQLPYRYIRVPLSNQFGQDLIDKYKSSPSTFETPAAFAEWFPGFYIRNSFGNGRVVQVDSTVVSLYYHRTIPIEGTDRDTTLYINSSYMAVTPEVLTNNNMSLSMAQSLRQTASERPVLVGPAGYDVELRFPGDKIADYYRANGGMMSVLNSLTFEIPVEEITNTYGIIPPPYVLMVKSSEKDSFFARSKVPDNVTSFYATYDNYNHRYVFSGMRDYILDLLKKETITEDDLTFTLTPVTVGFESNASNYSTSYYYYYYYSQAASQQLSVSTVVPYVSRPAMGILDLKKAKITLTFSVHKINNL